MKVSLENASFACVCLARARRATSLVSMRWRYTTRRWYRNSVTKLSAMVKARTRYSFQPAAFRASPPQVDRGVNTR